MNTAENSITTAKRTSVVIIDNYDSFTYNLSQTDGSRGDGDTQ